MAEKQKQKQENDFTYIAIYFLTECMTESPRIYSWGECECVVI